MDLLHLGLLVCAATLGERFSATPSSMDEVVRFFNERLPATEAESKPGKKQ